MQTATIKVGTELVLGTVTAIKRDGVDIEYKGARYSIDFNAAEKAYKDGTIEDEASK